MIAWPLCPPWVPLGLVASCLALAWLTRRRLEALPGLPEPGTNLERPRVTLCIPARNEERELGPALDSWLAQDYPELTIVVVDDGSSDGTGSLLARRAQAHPDRLRVLHNASLPPGWLGKNHALHLASTEPEALAAQWLLFADADVHAAPDLLRRAFAFLDGAPADILALLPAVDTVTWPERLFIPMATLGFIWAVPLASVPVPGRSGHCGVGAFTLVRRTAYDAVQGHAGAPMAAIDDMGLADRVKRAGFTNRVAAGGPFLHLRMYHGLGELVVAMRKNVMAVPGLFPLAPLALVLVLGASLSPLWLAAAGYPWAGFGLWLLVPPMAAEVHQRVSAEPVDLAWAGWPLVGLILAAGLAWAFTDRLRGVNHWRGREVKL